jgi:aconitate hydratase
MANVKPDIRKESISSFKLSDGRLINYYSLPYLESKGIGKISRLPFSIRIVLESLLRNLDNYEVTYEDVVELANWNAKAPKDVDIPFKVSRILMQDFTGVPAVVDMATMRDYVVKLGKEGSLIQPIVPIDLIIDHSVQVDAFNVANAIEINQEKEMERNAERYQLLKWGSQAYKGFRVFPPSAGICHQVNLEYLATCVATKEGKDGIVAMPDTLVGTDSHTTMINGLGVVGFGVGGIEAEAALLGQPVSFVMPKVLGVHLRGKLNDGITATDFALTLTKMLRDKGVVNMFVEFFGDGLGSLSLPDRATLSNMCPEYGATIALFPVDDETLRYMKSTGRSEVQIELVKKYYESQNMLGIDYGNVDYSDILEVDLGKIVPSVSGPSQPKQQIPLEDIANEFRNVFMLEVGEEAHQHSVQSKDNTRWNEESPVSGNGNGKAPPPRQKAKSIKLKYDDGYEAVLSDGDVVISSITSCTNTSNPYVMIAAGLLAKKALEHGLRVDTRKVKTSLGPGSRVVTRYLEKADLIKPLGKLGFDLVGYGCITCIGNSGKLIEKQSEAINANGLAVAAVLSGNRNYEARIHRDVKANYLMSPPLLVAFAIAGTVLKDLTREPLAKNGKGEDVYLKDIWPTKEEINDTVRKVLSVDMFDKEYGSNIFDVNPYWNNLKSPSGEMYVWEEKSTYIRRAPFFDDFKMGSERPIAPIKGSAVLAVFGDSISTDHISPAGAIGADSPAGKYLVEHGISQSNFNTYGSRRGNHEVMVRGTFANNLIKNLMLPGVVGGFTMHVPTKQRMPIYDAAMLYKSSGTPLVIMAGVEYGSGSSRDWAAKGPMLLGVKAIVAKSFERIHRSNLIGMGVIPLQFASGQDAEALQIDFIKPIDIELDSGMKPRDKVTMRYFRRDGTEAKAELTSRIDSQVELEYYKSGGILNYVIKKLAK